MLFRTNRLIVRYLYHSKHQLSLTISRIPVCLYHRNRKLREGRFCREMPPTTEAHIRCFEDEGKFNLTFSITDPNSERTREILLERNLQETVDALLRRLCTKVSNLSAKGKKKTKKQRSDEPTEAAADDSLSAHFLKNGSPVSGDVLCSDLFRDVENAELALKVGEREFQIFINRPYIEHIFMPKVLLAGFPAYPRKYSMFFANEKECDYSWYKHNVEEGTETCDPLHTGYVYTPTTRDVGSHLRLKCVPKRGKIAGEAMLSVSPTAVEAGPGQCFSDIRHSFTNECLAGDAFRVVSYNILADMYASSEAGKTELFAYCPEYARNIHYRKLLLLKELMGYNADLICLQEVDNSLFKRDLTNILDTVGLEGVFTKKGGEVNEGVACFYRRSRFRLIEDYSSLVFGADWQEKPYWKSIWEKVSSNENLCAFFSTLNTVVQVLAFEYVEKSNHKLIVANTHLYFRPNADIIRMMQAAFCLHLVEHVRNLVQKQEPNCTVSVIFCGDFNSTPECGVYQLFTKNHVPDDYHEWKDAPPDFKIEGITLRNCINFDSACGTPEFTNFTVGFEGCLDYIYYNNDSLHVQEVLPFPSREEVSEHIAIPSIVFPSDHIALVADLKWKK